MKKQLLTLLTFVAMGSLAQLDATHTPTLGTVMAPPSNFKATQGGKFVALKGSVDNPEAGMAAAQVNPETVGDNRFMVITGNPDNTGDGRTLSGVGTYYPQPMPSGGSGYTVEIQR